MGNLPAPASIGRRRIVLVRAILAGAFIAMSWVWTGVQAAPILSPFETAGTGVDSGELLLAELNCVACHQADTAVRTRLAPRASPRLGDTGLFITPQFLRAFLADPHAEKPGTTMPDVLHALEPAQKRDSAEALTHFLVSLNKAASSAPIAAEQFKIQQGRLLFHSVGCVACHAPQESASALRTKRSAGEDAVPNKSGAGDLEWLQQNSIPLGNLARKTTVEQLAQFLLDPLKVRSSGRMPSLNLSAAEAVAIAMYLLRDQASSPANPSVPARKIKGLAYYYLEKADSPNSPADSIAASNSGLLDRFPGPRQMIQGVTMRVAGSGIVDRFSVTPRQRLNEIAFTFTGNLTVPAAGRYTFYTASDDGSRLYVGDRLVVRNDGEHAMEECKGSVELAAGEHPVMVTYFNKGGGAELQVSYEGPGLAKQEIPADVLSHLGQPMIPLGDENFVVDPEKAARGRQLFALLGCAACHQLGSVAARPSPPAKPLADLNPQRDDGCLGSKVKRGLPQYQLSDAQRRAIQATLAEHAKLAQPLAAGAQINRTLAALNCLACHSSGGVGGPAAGRAEYFTVVGDADLGDEGRRPPHLTRVGDKLRPEWLREVLFNKGTVRPYMATRMPQFGRENVEALADAIVQADSSGATETPSEYNARDAKFGRKLVGREGLTCITCHTFARHKSLGVPAMDMTQMTKRLKRDWFRRYLLNPASLRPGTRMPSFWPDGQAANQEILEGNTERQIDAIWTFLSKGTEADLPQGLIQAKMELVADKEALIYRNFIQGAGSRAIGVAYPEKANLAFDANDLRLALIWHGAFIDASRHRTDRGVGFEPPLGDHVTKLPAGAPFAILPDANTPWPDRAGEKAGYQMRGYKLDEQRRPAFLYSFNNIQIEDYPVAVAGELDPALLRRLTLRSAQPAERLWFRAAVGSKIEEKQSGAYLVDGKVTLKLKLADGKKAIIRQSGGNAELLVPVVFNGPEAQIVEEIVW